MSNIDTHRIAERFSGLSAEQRRVVYDKIRTQGLGIGQFPILSRPSSQQKNCSPSYAQLRQWFLWRMDPQSSAYHITGALTLKGSLDSEALRGSFAALVARHDSLRTLFREDGEGGATQEVQDESDFALHEVDLSPMPLHEREVAIENQVTQLCDAPFDLEQGPLLRVGLLRLAKEEHLLVVVMHHIVSDGWSIQLIIDEFAADYCARVMGEVWQPTSLPIQYADYSVWQRQWMEAGEKERQLAYWQQELGDEHPVLQLPTDRPRRNDGHYHAARHQMVLPESLISGLRQLTQAQGATLFITLLTGFQALLYRYTGQEDIRVGVPIANRHRTETQGVVGLFVNTQVLRNQLNGRQSLVEALEQGKRAALGAQEHQDLPFEQLVEALQPERSLSHTPLFQVMFSHQRQDHGALQTLPGLELSSWPLEKKEAQFELTLDVVERADGYLETNFVYAEELFDSTTIERLAQHYVAVLEALTEIPERALGDIDLLDKGGHLQLQAWGVNPQYYSDVPPIHHLIERQAAATPEATALIFAEQRLSYAELNAHANRLAHYLIGLGVKPETRVGIAMERSVEMVVGLLGILKAGGAYVPLDPDYPAERLAYIAEDSGIELLLTQQFLRDILPVLENQSVIELDQLDVTHHASTNPSVELHGEHLAYVIYTSGSTGRPKGAAIRHNALTNCMLWMQEAYQITDADAVLHKAPFGFDVSVWEIFWPLSVGARLVVAQPGDHRDPERIIALIQKHGVTTLNFVPSMLKAFLAYPDIKTKTRLKHIMCGGEAVPAALQQDVAECLDGANLHDLYGPTETTIHVTHWWCRGDAQRQIPIGRPISGTRTYVLDSELNLVPQGIEGELYLGGVSLARGYLNRSDLTADRFVADPFTAGERLYRTGDLVRWREDGQLEYLGRLDHQVKIRGLRIELGEIEAELLVQPEVREAVVVAQEVPGSSRLVAYVVPQTGIELDTSSLREALGQKLPDYMVPGLVVTLDALPLNANGKVDRKALPEPEFVGVSQYEPPQGEVEETLAKNWSEVLGVQRVGRHDNFFELGGHSLLVTQLVARVRREQSVELPVRSVFDTPILKDLATYLEKLETLEDEHSLSNLDLSLAPQSFAQQRLWFLHQLEPSSTAYHLPGMLRLKGALDEQALQRAFDGLASRHAILRTRLLPPPEGKTVPQQVVDAPAPINIERTDLNESGDLEKALSVHAQEFMGRPFLLSEECLWRAGLVRVSEKEWRLLICMHHAISDGLSVSVLLRDFSVLYEAICRGEEPILDALPVQYTDFAVWQRQWLSGGEGERQLNYWRHQLGHEHPVLELPADRPRPARQSFLGAYHRFTLTEPLSKQVHALAAAYNATPFMVLLATYNVLLHRLSGQNDLRVGVPIAGRNRHETENLIGFFVNTQVLRCEIDTASHFDRVLESVREAAIDAQAHQDLPFEQLVEVLQPERSLSHNPLFQVLYDHQRRGDGHQIHLPGLETETLEIEGGTTQFDLALNTQEDGDGVLLGSWNYATDLFDVETIKHFHCQFECLLEQVVASPESVIGDYDLLDENQRQQLKAWNHTTLDYGQPRPVHRLFERQAMLHPGREALIFGEQRLSYSELDRAANRLAHYLLAQGMSSQTLVGLAVERSVEMVVALYAMHKAGTAYVPIDPDHPQARQQQVLGDADVTLLLTHDAVVGRLSPDHGLAIVNLDRLDLSCQPTTVPNIPLSPKQRAYVIYTSGSTGKPKGVANTHEALYNRLQWMQSAYQLEEGDSVLQKTPYSFDVSVWEFFWPLMVGARLVVAQPGDHHDPQRMVKLIRKESVTTLHFVPSMLTAFLAQEDLSGCDSLRRIVCSGEALPKDVQDRALERLPQARIYNLYGPTEAAIDVTHWTCCQDERTTVPIGRPIGNLQIHILDSRLTPQPIGIPGELYIGGAGLAEGYHGRPDLTAEHFIPSPFAVGQRLYRSGDLARWCRDGTLEYLGRLDHQIKLRGLRIELGEIEAVMRTRPDVDEAAVTTHHGQLVGYVQGSDVDIEALQAELRHYLPEYMVPTHIVTLETFPLSANGKLDRKALPSPAMKGADYEVPQTQTERQLAELWQEVLEVERVGRRDNFFSLGGHSLLGVHLVHRIQKVLKKTLPLNVLFESATLAALAAMLERVPVEETPALQPAVRGQLAPQSFAQQRLWFLAQLEPESCAYHLPSGMRLQGDLDEEALIAAFEKMIVRHESLRTCFCHGEDGNPQQWVLQTTDVPIERHDLRFLASDVEAAVETLLRDVSRRPFDLEAVPPWRGALVQVGEREWCLLICMHHIISDGWSMQVLLEELVAFYRSESLGELEQAEPLVTQYADYAIWQREQLSGAELERQLAWWKAQLGDEHPPLDLPADRSRPAQRYGSGAQHTFNFPPELVDQLRQSARDQQASLFMLILTGFAALLHRLSGQRDLRIGVPVAGRHQPGTEGIIGFFVNTLVLRAETEPGDRISDLLAHVCKRTREVHAHADLPFEQLVEALQPERSLSHNPLFQVGYNHQVFDHRPLDRMGSVCCEPLAAPVENAHFDLVLGTQEDENGRITGHLNYATDIFNSDTVVRMADQLLLLLKALAECPQRLLCDIDLLSDREHGQLQQWGVNEECHSQDEPMHCLIERQAAAKPKATALIFDDRQITYAELNGRANQVAHYLIGLGVKPETRVGIAMERSVEMVVGLLAILKAGGAYVPLDPEYPSERLAFIADDSGIELLLTQHHLRESLPVADNLSIVELDRLDVAHHAATNPAVALHGEHLAYVIYTSGSTGRPKGAAIRHDALTNCMVWMQETYQLTDTDAVLHKAPFGFDVSVWEIFWPLSVGVRLVVAQPGDHRDPERIIELIQRHGVTTINFVPSMLKAFLAYPDVKAKTRLKHIMCGGEAVPAALQQDVAECLDGANLHDLYGPTETTIHVTHWWCRDDAQRQIPIGRPISGTCTYVLDAELNLVPQGVAGELYLGGVSLARGYLNRSDLTADRFVADPFAQGERLYRTGDLVRWREDGQLEYLGRLDHQVKIRGLRIELGEVETELLAQPKVREAIVVAQEGAGGSRLVAYVVPQAGTQLDTSSLRAALGQKLPDYMVPGVVVTLEALPLNANGKVDRKALPEPDLASGSQYEAPRGEAEENLAEIWSEVLGVEQVGRYDNFFELGGHSLLALKVLEQMRDRGLTAQVRTLFQHPELAAFAQALAQAPEQAEIIIPPNLIPYDCQALRPEMLTLIDLNAEEIRVVEAAVPGGAANIQDIYPLASLQEGILFHHRLQEKGDAYVTPRLLGFDNRERLEAFIASFNQLIARHDILRTAVLWERIREPVQVVCRYAVLEIEWSAVPDEATGRVAEWLYTQTDPEHHRIDVRRAPMLRAVAAYDAEQGRWLLQLPSHHLVMDHTTLELLVEEIALLQQGRVDALPDPIPFRNFVAQARLGVSPEEHEAFFRERLSDIEEPTAPFGLLEVRGDGSDIEEVRLPLEDGLAQQVRQQAQRHGVSTASLFHLAWALVLSKTTGHDDVVFGTVLFGRMQGIDGAERALGMFINTLPVRIQMSSQRVDKCLRHTHDALSELMHHEHASLGLAQRCSGLPGGMPLFTSLLNYRYNAPQTNSRFIDAWKGMESLGGQERTNYPIGMAVDDLGEGFQLVGQVSRKLGAQRLCEYLRAAVADIVESLQTAPQRAVSDISLLGKNERQLMSDWGVNTQRYSDAPPIHHLIENYAAATPEATALIFAEQHLSYAELNARANRLAHYLIGLGVKPETRVGIAMERSVEMVVGLLAILKAGGAYVPLDPEYPSERLAFIADDSGIELLLTQHHLRESLPVADNLSIVELDRLDVAHHAATNPAVALHGEHLAYVIYTSGSTGRPKGAAIRHDALTNCMVWMQETYQLTDTDAVLHKAPFGFDVSVWEIFWPLSVGVRLVVAQPGDHRDPERIIELIQRHGVTTINFVPSMLKAFLAYPDVKAKTRLKHIMCGGEAVPAALQQDVAECLDGANLHDLYGPTETTIHVTHWWCRDDAQRQIPIGRPISGTCTYVLDAELNLVPQGVAGELYLGGVSLARGYLNRSDLTADRFVADPFAQGERLYRTGDLVRWREDGQLEYLGRLDHQVKIRGLRIELGEVETELLAQPKVREAIVVAQEGAGGSRLVAYVVPQAGTQLDTSSLRAALGQKLPDYMVPGVVVTLEALPLNANGKVDRKALPEPNFEEKCEYVTPSTPEARQLAEIWQKVLGVERVGETDNFFELGGDSLLSLQVMSHVQALQEPRLNFKLFDLMQKPTIADLLGVRNHTEILPKGAVMLNGECRHQPPLFCIHAVMGTVFDYQPLARRLHGVCTVYGLPCRMLADPQHCDTSLEAMADDYVETIRRIQPLGPYRLLGWSLGGALATMIAARFEKQGQDVSLLALVDPYIPGVVRDVENDWQRDFVNFASVILPGVSLEPLGNFEEGTQEPSEEVCAIKMAKLIASYDTSSREGYAGLGSKELARIFYVARHLKHLSLQVDTLPALNCEVDCWWANERPKEQQLALEQQLDQLPRCSIKTSDDHFFIITGEALLSKIEKVLKETDNSRALYMTNNMLV